MIPVAEIFGPTIQGEGPNIGKKCIFLRVAGCDFKCAWCDSKFAWEVNKDTALYPNHQELALDLINKCKSTNTYHVILTGGNPCLYDFGEIIEQLHDNNIQVDVETQGSILPEWLSKVDQLVISPKAPSSKQPDVYDTIEDYLQRLWLTPINVAIKIPVFDDMDFEFALRYYHLVENFWFCKLYLSVGNTDTQDKGNISERVLEDYKKLIEKTCQSEMTNVYILPQLHTLVWGNKQGV